jgi:hypothetical protein
MLSVCMLIIFRGLYSIFANTGQHLIHFSCHCSSHHIWLSGAHEWRGMLKTEGHSVDDILHAISDRKSVDMFCFIAKGNVGS